MEQTKAFRRNRIKQHLTNCVHCGHHHDPQPIIEQYNAHGKTSMSYYCDSCNKYNRVKQTKEGLISFNRIVKVGVGKNNMIREHRMECAYCQHPMEKQDFQFLLKKRNVRRTVCSKCHKPLIARRTALGFYSTTKAEYKKPSVKSKELCQK